MARRERITVYLILQGSGRQKYVVGRSVATIIQAYVKGPRDKPLQFNTIKDRPVVFGAGEVIGAEFPD